LIGWVIQIGLLIVLGDNPLGDVVADAVKPTRLHR
jgi:hypothetical protein